jgi:type II secretory pathway pseudopilin PulG
MTMHRSGADAGFLLIEALIAAALLALSATVIVGVSSDAISASARELDEMAALSVLESLGLELQRFGKASPQASTELVVGTYRLRVLRIDNPDPDKLSTHEIRAEAIDPQGRDLVVTIYAPGL